MAGFERGVKLSFRLTPPPAPRLIGAPSLSQSRQELLVLLGEGGGRKEGMRVTTALRASEDPSPQETTFVPPAPLLLSVALQTRKPWFVLCLGGASGQLELWPPEGEGVLKE